MISKKVVIIIIIIAVLLVAITLITLNKKFPKFSFFSAIDYSKATKLFNSLQKTTSGNAFADVELNPFKYNKTNE